MVYGCRGDLLTVIRLVDKPPRRRTRPAGQDSARFPTAQHAFYLLCFAVLGGCAGSASITTNVSELPDSPMAPAAQANPGVPVDQTAPDEPDPWPDSPLPFVDEPVENAEGEYETAEDWSRKYRGRRLDVNGATRDQIESVTEIDVSELNALLMYRDLRGRIRSKAELESITGLSQDTISRLADVLTGFETEPSVIAQQKETDETWLEFRMTTDRKWKPDESAAAAPGNPFRRTIRLNVERGSFRFALTAQNEPGEKLRWIPGKKYYGFDHMASYLHWSSPSSRLQLIFGDFRVDAGQGVIHSRPYGTRLSADAPWRTLRSWSGISGYSGSTRQATFRGLAVHGFPHPSVSVSAFLSNKGIDARRVQDDSHDETDSQQTVYSIVQSDLHVSNDQLSRRHNLNRRSAGLLLEWHLPAGRVGFQFSKSWLSHPVKLDSGMEEPSNRFSYGSIYWSLAAGGWSVIAEATGISGQPAVVFGIVHRATRSIRLFASSRFLPGKGTTLFGKPFGFSTASADQTGITLGAGGRISSSARIATSLDVRAEGARGESPFFSTAAVTARFFMTIDVTPTATIQLLVKQKSTEARGSLTRASGSAIDTLVPARLTSATLLVRLSPNDGLKFDTRLDVNRHAAEDWVARGVHLGMCISIRFWRSAWLVMQESVFRVPTFENRIYVYESDVAGRLSVPALQGMGTRSSIVVNVPLGMGRVLELKYATSSVRQPDTGSVGNAWRVEPVRSHSVGVQLTASL